MKILGALYETGIVRPNTARDNVCLRLLNIFCVRSGPIAYFIMKRLQQSEPKERKLSNRDTMYSNKAVIEITTEVNKPI